MILFVAGAVDALEPLDELGGARIVAPITDPASDWDFFQEERAPGRLRTLPHAVITIELTAFGFTRAGSESAYFTLAPEAQRALVDSDDRAEPIATLRKLARVAEARGERVYAMESS